MSTINDIPAEIDLQLYVKAEQGDDQARNELKRLANKGWVSSVGWSPTPVRGREWIRRGRHHARARTRGGYL